MKFDISTLDRELFRLIHINLHRDWLDRFVLLITYTGDGWFHAGMILTMLAIKKTRAYGLASLAAFAFSGILQAIAKELVQRPRPSNFDFAKPLEEIYGNTSFPSGHTTTSFAIAFMIAWMVQRNALRKLGLGPLRMGNFRGPQSSLYWHPLCRRLSWRSCNCPFRNCPSLCSYGIPKDGFLNH